MGAIQAKADHLNDRSPTKAERSNSAKLVKTIAEKAVKKRSGDSDDDLVKSTEGEVDIESAMKLFVKLATKDEAESLQIDKLNKAMKVDDKVKELAIKITKKFVSYGIGSAGANVRGISKTDANCLEIRRLDVFGELKLFENYANKYNECLGTITVGDPDKIGTSASDKKYVLEKIRTVVRLAVAAEADLVLYYTGHGEEGTGDWCIGNETVSFDEVYQIIAQIHKIVRETSDDLDPRKYAVVIVSDCCYSGNWVKLAMDNDGRSLADCHGPVVVLSACEYCMTVRDGVFAKAFWTIRMPEDSDVDAALKRFPIVSAPIKPGLSDAAKAKRRTVNGYWSPIRKDAHEKWFHG